MQDLYHHAIPLTDLHPHPQNPRTHIRTNDQGWHAFLGSISTLGITSPIIVREHPTGPGYQILSGHRRRHAAHTLGHDTAPAIVKQDLTEQQALEILVTENKDRENLTPIEETRGIQLLLDSGLSHQQIADDFHRPLSWVYRRAQLTALHPLWTALAEAVPIPATTLELLARYTPERQQQLAEEFEVPATLQDLKDHPPEEYNYTTDDLLILLTSPTRARELRRMLAQNTHDLSLAPWSLTDSLLHPTAGPCSECPHRTSCQPELFDLDDFLDPHNPIATGKKKAATPDYCLNPDCWTAKTLAHTESAFQKLQKKHPTALRVSSNYLLTPADRADGLLASASYYIVEKGTPDAIPALITHGSDLGKEISIRLIAKQSTTQALSRQGTPADPAAAQALKEEQLQKRRLAWICAHLIEHLHDRTQHHLPAPVAYRAPTALLRLLVVFGTGFNKWRPEAPAERQHIIDSLIENKIGTPAYQSSAAIATAAEWLQAIEESSGYDQALTNTPADLELAYAQARTAGHIPAETAPDLTEATPWELLTHLSNGVTFVNETGDIAGSITSSSEIPIAWSLLRPQLATLLTVHQVGTLTDTHIIHTEMISELLGLDIHHLRQDAAHAIPTPATWNKTPEKIETIITEKLPEAQDKPKSEKVRKAPKKTKK